MKVICHSRLVDWVISTRFSSRHAIMLSLQYQEWQFHSHNHTIYQNTVWTQDPFMLHISIYCLCKYICLLRHLICVVNVETLMQMDVHSCCKYMMDRSHVIILWTSANYAKLCAVFCWILLTHLGRDKMDAISQTTLSNAFSWIKRYEFRLIFHWSLFLRFQLTIFQHWFR